MATANPTTKTPGYVAGTWAIDPIHSDVSFTVRHMMVSKVRGRFSKFEGTIRIGDDFADSSVEASIDMGSIDTNNEQRNGHIRSADFFDAATYPTMSYRSLRVRPSGNGYVVERELPRTAVLNHSRGDGVVPLVSAFRCRRHIRASG